MPSSQGSNLDSEGTTRTAERTFPARKLVKSPRNPVDNPFNRLYGLRKAPVHDEEMGSYSPEPVAPEQVEHPHAKRDDRDGSNSSSSPCTSHADKPGDFPTTKFEQLHRVQQAVGSTNVDKVDDRASTQPTEFSSEGEFFTKRFEFTTSNSGAQYVNTGIEGSEIQACEDEPIHTPGAVQSFGVLITLREVAPLKFIVCHVSEVSRFSMITPVCLPPRILAIFWDLVHDISSVWTLSRMFYQNMIEVYYSTSLSF